MNAGSSRSSARSIAYPAVSSALPSAACVRPVPPEHVAGELVEQDHQRQGAWCVVPPAVKAARSGLLVEVPEPVADLPIERLVLLEPGVAELAVAGFSLATEPELQDLGCLLSHIYASSRPSLATGRLTKKRVSPGTDSNVISTPNRAA